MAKLFFYADFERCAGCGTHVMVTRGIGAIELTAPGKPIIFYVTCNRCMERMRRKDADFVTKLGDRVVKQARDLGAFAPVEEFACVGGSDE